MIPAGKSQGNSKYQVVFIQIVTIDKRWETFILSKLLSKVHKMSEGINYLIKTYRYRKTFLLIFFVRLHHLQSH